MKTFQIFHTGLALMTMLQTINVDAGVILSTAGSQTVIDAIARDAAARNLRLPNAWNSIAPKVAAANADIILDGARSGTQNFGGFTLGIFDASTCQLPLDQLTEQCTDLVNRGKIAPQIYINPDLLRDAEKLAATLTHEGSHLLDFGTEAGRVYWMSALTDATGKLTDSQRMIFSVVDTNFAHAEGFKSAFNTFTEVRAYLSVPELPPPTGPQASAIASVQQTFFSGGVIGDAAASQSVNQSLEAFASYNGGFKRGLSYHLLPESGKAVARSTLSSFFRASAAGGDLVVDSATRAALSQAWKASRGSFAKAIPFLGIGAGAAMSLNSYCKGNYWDSAFSAIGCIPGGGDLVDLTYGIGTASYTAVAAYAESCDRQDEIVKNIKEDLFDIFASDDKIREMAQAQADCLKNNQNVDPRVVAALQAIAISDPNEPIPPQLYINLYNAIVEAAQANAASQNTSGRLRELGIKRLCQSSKPLAVAPE